jgi:hypothetical protein
VTDPNPLGPLSRLAARLRKDVLEAAGLKLQSFHVIPNSDPEGTHSVQAVFVKADEDEAPKPKKDDDFEKLMSEQRSVDESDKADAARKDLKDLAEDLKRSDRGLGLDDD